MASTTSRATELRAVSLLLLTYGCATHTPPAGPPDQAAATTVASATEPKQRLRLVFEWTLQERDAKFSGEGAIRLEPPYHVRLDLFGPRGEGYLSAALVDFELRLPPGSPTDLLPPPAMLWTVFGVFRPPQGAQLVSTKADSAQTVLQYQAGDQTWSFTFSANRLTRSEWQGPAQGRQTVEIREHSTRGLPAVVVYRDWRAFRELSVTLTQANDVAEAFPPETWLPGIR